MSGGDTIRVRCDDCSHLWIAAYLPMRMALIAKLMKGIACPKCGASSKRIFLAGKP